LGNHNISALWSDEAALARFAQQVDVATVETEHIPIVLLQRLEALGVSVAPLPKVVGLAQNRAAEKEALTQLGLPVAPYWVATSQAALAERLALPTQPYPCVVKTATGGYDGHGQVTLHTYAEAQTWLASPVAHVPRTWVVEAWLPFARELSLLAARNPQGDVVCYPLAENTHRHHVLWQTVAPALNVTPAQQAQANSMMHTLLHSWDVVGLLALELFELASGELVINEVAPRPHNSGHWTLDGAAPHQFDLHWRACLGAPLPTPRLLAPRTLMQNLLGHPQGDETVCPIAGLSLASVARCHPQAVLHRYSKLASRPKRKLGHINLPLTHPNEANHPEALLARLHALASGDSHPPTPAL
jgi:5-(carboxyamino)imidazole ribonucleotide synthase